MKGEPTGQSKNFRIEEVTIDQLHEAIKRVLPTVLHQCPFNGDLFC